eukprot:CAMPEP_0116856390 /NCGR_PEP_ID=MMETSP0418-20121206/19883_1 /TAXON_ID=1158023 /ORGANISM="Astrosyne radiata, Strain 13vi08-1A" /LENGTH=213 /DNA_ID=CAMNT_0004489781 /DNA_START=14 /DNA_END=655 /DNA_ORIENTATION=-
MTLVHPGGHEHHLAYKVMTNQPRRYLVKPSQGVIAPNRSQTLTILISERYKRELIKAFERIGSAAFQNCPDKFMVQSCVVSEKFAYAFHYHDNNDSTDDNDNNQEQSAEEKPIISKVEISSLFKKVFGPKQEENHAGVPVKTKKLPVYHTMVDEPPPPDAELEQKMKEMSKEELMQEMRSLKTKYDELVDYTVSLTSERDALRRKLEHYSKRK